MATKKSPDSSPKIDPIIAKSDDGSLQVTFTIPFAEIKTKRDETVKELAQDIEVPGFRKGNAPLDKVVEKISPNTILEKTLAKILPNLFADAIKANNLKPAIYPKFELLSAQEDENWQVRANTCELPDINLGNYKTAISEANKGNAIWTPDKAGKETKELTREEKEQKVLHTLIDSVKITIPKILIEEEVNSRLSSLLNRLEKLGLSLESYIASLGKTAQDLRAEYAKAATEALAIDLILSKISEAENLQVDKKDVDSAIEAAKSDPKLSEEINTPERRRFIEVILKRRKALDFLLSL